LFYPSQASCSDSETSTLLVPSTRCSTLCARSVPSGCRTGLERSTTTRSERAFSFRLPPRTEDCSVPVVVPSDNVLCLSAPVAQCSSVTMYWLLQTDWHCTVVLQQQCDNATSVILISTTTTLCVWSRSWLVNGHIRQPRGQCTKGGGTLGCPRSSFTT